MPSAVSMDGQTPFGEVKAKISHGPANRIRQLSGENRLKDYGITRIDSPAPHGASLPCPGFLGRNITACTNGIY